jgi:hypothetical protein
MVSKALNIVTTLMTGIFYLPGVNIFFGSMQCLVKKGTSSFDIGLSCKG